MNNCRGGGGGGGGGGGWPSVKMSLIIRPNLEYACPVWDPFHKAEINALENVQKFGLRTCVKSCMGCKL